MQRARPVRRSLHPEGAYPCPVCRWGQISSMAMMDAFACDVCRHFFVPQFDRQILQMADRQPPLSWQWTGSGWRGARAGNTNLKWVFLLAGVPLALLPPAIVLLGAYLFPPVPGTSLAWFPYFWAAIALLAHGSLVVWLAIEAYQFPLGLYVATALRRWRERISIQNSK